MDEDDFVSLRHKRLAAEAGALSDSDGDSAEDEPELNEEEVLPLDVSDSDEDEDEDDEANDEDDVEGGNGESKRDWGGRRRMWYGGDTHEYEVMADEERGEALKDEEEEAVRLQKAAISSLSAQDFGQDEDDEDGDDDDQADGEADIDMNDKVISSLTNKKREKLKKQSKRLGRDELNILINEAAECEREISKWQRKMKRKKGCETAALLFHLYSTFVCNVAFFLSLHEDPEAENIDIRTHPVVLRIVRIRSLLLQTLKEADSVNADREEHEHEEAVIELDDENDESVDNSDDDVDEIEKVEEIEVNGRAKIGRQKRKDKKRSLDNANDTRTERSKKSKKQKQPKRHDEENDADDDDDIVNHMFSNVGDIENDDTNSDLDEESQDRKRRKLNRLVNEMERNRKNKESRRMASADLERVRHEQKRKRRIDSEPEPEFDIERNEGDGEDCEGQAGMGLGMIPEDFDNMDMDMDDMDLGMLYGDDGKDDDDNDEDDELEHLAAVKKDRKKAKNEARKSRRMEEAAKPHVYTFDDTVDEDEKRKASTQVVKNRGLTRYRPREKKTPRARNRAAYAKALKKRKSITREYQGKPGAGYSGETTGINISSRRGSKLSSI